ncbi:hypothetical protein NQZ68_003806 [Dissostichus eleginoides]|nr:hypothetical protein NQZ68_003806 [Dissostichus eleginoides]
MEKERLRKEEMERFKELERFKEMERRQLMELEKQKQAERGRQQIIEMEKRRLRERMERMERDEAEKMRQTAKQQEAERQRLKERQKKEEQERVRLESSHLRPKVLDLDSVRRNDSFSKASPQRSDLATRWKEPSPRAEESYRSAILDIDSFTSPALVSPSKDLFPVSGIQGVDAAFGARLQPTPDVDVSWRGPPQTSGGITSPIWTTSPQDPWELRPVEMSVDKPEPRKLGSKLSPEQLLLRQEERLLAPQRNRSAGQEEPLHLASLSRTASRSGGSPGVGPPGVGPPGVGPPGVGPPGVGPPGGGPPGGGPPGGGPPGVGPPDGGPSSAPAEQIWLPRQPQPPSGQVDVCVHRRSQGSQELNRMRSRSVSRRSAPSISAVEGSLSRMRSRSAHRELEDKDWEKVEECR